MYFSHFSPGKLSTLHQRLWLSSEVSKTVFNSYWYFSCSLFYNGMSITITLYQPQVVKPQQSFFSLFCGFTRKEFSPEREIYLYRVCMGLGKPE